MWWWEVALKASLILYYAIACNVTTYVSSLKMLYFYQDFWHSFKTCLTVPDSNKGNVLNFLELKIWTFDNVTQSARVLVTNIRASALVGEAPHKQNTDRECQSNSENQQHQLCTTQELCNHRSLTGVFRQKNNDRQMKRWSRGFCSTVPLINPRSSSLSILFPTDSRIKQDFELTFQASKDIFDSIKLRAQFKIKDYFVLSI